MESRSSRSGCHMAKNQATAPPQSWPTTCDRSAPSASMRRATSRASTSTRYASSAAGLSDLPYPRKSGATAGGAGPAGAAGEAAVPAVAERFGNRPPRRDDRGRRRRRGQARRTAPGDVEGEELREQDEHVVLRRGVPTDRPGPPARNSNG